MRTFKGALNRMIPPSKKSRPPRNLTL